MIVLAAALATGCPTARPPDVGADSGVSEPGDSGPATDGGPVDSGAGPGSDAGSNGGADAGSDAGLPTITEFWQLETTALCEVLVNCGGGQGDVVYCAQLPNIEGNGFNSSNIIDDEIDAGRVQYDPEYAAACLAAIGAEACSDLLNGSPWPAGCAGLFTGTVATGAPCAADVECLSGLCVQGSADGGCGTCRAPNPLCHDSWQCATGQVCEVETSHCVTEVPPGAAGQPCGTNNACQAGSYCNGDVSPATCAVRGSNGGFCPWGGPFGSCQAGLACTPGPENDEYNGICLPWATVGQTCVSGQCSGDLFCNLSGICEQPPSSGPCAEEGSGCAYPAAYCDTMEATPTCLPVRQLGDECDPNSEECGSLQCQASTQDPSVGTCQYNFYQCSP
jgi:hypothetical protein